MGRFRKRVFCCLKIHESWSLRKWEIAVLEQYQRLGKFEDLWLSEHPRSTLWMSMALLLRHDGCLTLKHICASPVDLSNIQKFWRFLAQVSFGEFRGTSGGQLRLLFSTSWILYIDDSKHLPAHTVHGDDFWHIWSPNTNFNELGVHSLLEHRLYSFASTSSRSYLQGSVER